MDLEMPSAAMQGDIEFLKQAVNSKPPHEDAYFLVQTMAQENMFHLAARFHTTDFIKEAIKILPTRLLIKLLSLPESFFGHNILHCAVTSYPNIRVPGSSETVDNVEIVQDILEFYKSYSGPPLVAGEVNHPLNKPWLAVDKDKRTPLHIAMIEGKNERVVMDLLSRDMELLLQLVDSEGNSPLYLAVKKRYCVVVEKILSSNCDYSLSGPNGSTPLHVSPYTTDNNKKSLLEKHPDLLDILDNRGFTVLHQWAESSSIQELTLLSNNKGFSANKSKLFRDLILRGDNTHGDTPLHMGIKSKVIFFVKALINGYHRELRGGNTIEPVHNYPLWKIQNKDGDTPLHLAISSKLEDLALSLLSFDSTLCHISNKKGESPLFIAVDKGCDLLVDKIFEIHKNPPYSTLQRDDGLTVFHLNKCSEKTMKLLLGIYPDYLDIIDKNCIIMKLISVLCFWTRTGELFKIEFILKGEFPIARSKVFKDFIHIRDGVYDDTPLHIAIKTKNFNFVQALIDAYQQELKQPGTITPLDHPLWKSQNKDGDTPLHLALCAKHEKFALDFLLLNSTLCEISNNKGESPLFVAVREGCEKVVKEILRNHENPPYSMLQRNDGLTVLHLLQFCPEKTAGRLLEKFWWMMKLKDDRGKIALDEAKEANILWLVILLMNPSSIKKEPFDWVTACKRKESSAVMAFIDTCEDLQQVCREEIDSPLHHIELRSYREYLNFLKIPSIAELKNKADKDGSTPLHRALERKDMHFAKALLIDIGVERNKVNHKGETPMDLLAKLWKNNEDWERMCKQVEVNPLLKTSYIQPGTDLDQMRNTLSVVAALLATITFAAAFTLPGGLNDKGNALLGKKASFVVFLLADAYAMCASILVLFCLMWSMVSTRDMASLLVDRSVLILMQSLYGTMLAFMTGIYTVIEQSSSWAAIIIFIMCSFVIFLTHRTVLHKVLAKLIPTTNRERKDPIRLLEEGSTSEIQMNTK